MCYLRRFSTRSPGAASHFRLFWAAKIGKSFQKKKLFVPKSFAVSPSRQNGPDCVQDLGQGSRRNVGQASGQQKGVEARCSPPLYSRSPGGCFSSRGAFPRRAAPTRTVASPGPGRHFSPCGQPSPSGQQKGVEARRPPPLYVRPRTVISARAGASPRPRPKPASRRASARPSSPARCWPASGRPRWR